MVYKDSVKVYSGRDTVKLRIVCYKGLNLAYWFDDHHQTVWCKGFACKAKVQEGLLC